MLNEYLIRVRTHALAPVQAGQMLHDAEVLEVALDAPATVSVAWLRYAKSPLSI